MSLEITYLINLHKEGKIDDNALNKALNALQPTPAQTTKPDVQSAVVEKLHKRRRDKKKKRRQKRKYEELQKSVINELKQVLRERNSFSVLNSVDKPLCGYFNAYEIDASKYKDASILFADKKSIIASQIKRDIKEYNGVKFSIGLSIQFFHDEGNGKQKQVIGQNHGEQSAVLDDINEDKFYDNQVVYLQTWIEKFTNTASGLEKANCIKLYLNIAKYEPIKGSSYIPLPKALANKKAIINVQNDDDRCLEWALKSAMYPAKNNVSNKYSYTKCSNLNMDGIDFPTPISQISRVEKQNNLAINVYGAMVSPKLEKIYVFPYRISKQPKDRQRINLL